MTARTPVTARITRGRDYNPAPTGLPAEGRHTRARRAGALRPGSACRPIAAGGTHNKLSLNSFHHRRINHDKTLVEGKVPISDYRGYAKRRRKTDHSGFNRTFSRVIKERSFRFNNRDDENALNYLR
jgi:hypothetical protein